MSTNVDDILKAANEPIRDKLDAIIENTRSKDDASDDQESVEETVFEKENTQDSERTKRTEKSDDDSGEEAGDIDVEEKPEKKSTQKTEEADPDPKAEIDDYGNPLAKGEGLDLPDPSKPEVEEKLYTKSDLNRYIRERLDRMKVPESQRVEVQEKISTNMQKMVSDPNANEDDWITELKHVVKDTINEERQAEQNKRQTEINEREYQEDVRIQRDFENKFTAGIGRIKDFNAVAAKMPISDSMMLGIRNFEDPAGFIYAAAKNRPEEIKKIWAMRDPLSQAAALGRLEESLRRTARKTSNAPPPISRKKGDLAKGEKPAHTVDELIMIDTNRKLGRSN